MERDARGDSLDEWLPDEAFLRRIARSIARDRDEAEELVQDTWLATLRARPKGVADRRRWLAAVARRLWASRMRRRASERSADATLRAREPIGGEPADAPLARRELARLLADAIAGLPANYREVLRLRFAEGLEPREIATRLQRPLRTVLTQSRRGMSLLRESLDRRCRGRREIWLGSLLAVLPHAERAPEAEQPPARRPAGRRATAVGGALAVILTAWLGWRSVDSPTSPPISVADARPASLPGVANAVPTAGTRVAQPADARPPDVAPAGETPPGADAAPSVVATVHVRVTDLAGRTLPDASVELRHVAGYLPRARTDSTGEAPVAITHADFIPDPESPRTILLSASKDGFERSLDTIVRIAEGADELTQRIVLPGPEVELRARVLLADGTPAADVKVIFGQALSELERSEGDAATRPGTWRTRTDAQGRVTVRHLGVRLGGMAAFVPGGGIVHVDLDFAVPGTHEQTVVLPEPSFATGTVTDEAGEPVAGATVWTRPPDVMWLSPLYFTTKSDESGRYRIPVLPRSRTELMAQAPNREQGSALTAVSIASGEVKTWDPLLTPPQPLRVRVVDEGNEPLSGWWIDAVDPESFWPILAQADSEGRATLLVPDRGEFIVSVRERQEHGPARARARVAAPTDGEHVIVIGAGQRSTAKLVGRVAPMEWIAPAQIGIEVILDDFTDVRRFGIGDTSGEFEIAGVLPGTYHVEATGPLAYRWYVGEYELAAGEVRDLGRIEPPRPGTLTIDDSDARDRQGRDRTFTVIKRMPYGQGRSYYSWQGRPSEPLVLTPGDYWLDFQGDDGRTVRFEIEAGSATVAPLR